MKRIIKVTSILGIATLVRIFSGLIRAKVLAWQLGPSGLGIIGQALMYSGFTIQLCSLNMPMGITKGISESIARGKEGDIPLIINTAWTFQLIASLAFIAVVIPFSMPITKCVFTDSKYWIYLVGITFVTPFAIYLIGMADPIFYGYKKIAEYTKLIISYTLIGLVLVLVMVSLFKVEGMLMQILAIAFVGFFMSSHFIRKNMALRPKPNLSLFKDRQSREISSSLFQYGLISFIPGNINMLAMLFLRGMLIKQYGIDANGFYQVAYGMSGYYLPFVTNGIWGHFYPQMCALTAKEDVNRELNEFVRFAILVSTAIAAGVIIFRKYIILILFSDQFIKAYDLLAIQSAGDIFFVLFCVFSTSLMARKKFKGVIWISTIGYNAVLFVSYFLLRSSDILDFRSLNIAIALTNIALVIVHLLYSRLETGFALAKKNVLLICKSLVFLMLILVLPDKGFLTVVAQAIFFLIWVYMSVTMQEIIGLKDLAFSPFKRNGASV